MSWRIGIHPQGGMVIEHLGRPRFSARWTTGAFPIESVCEGAFFWTDAGSGAEDAIHLYAFAWSDAPPDDRSFKELMGTALNKIDQFILRQAL